MSDEAGKAQGTGDRASAEGAGGTPAADRTYSAASLGRLLSIDKRTVNAWAAEGCPHGEKTGRGGTQRTFSKLEVATWLRSQGRVLPAGLDGLFASDERPATGDESKQASTPAAAARASTAPESTGSVDYSDLISKATASIVELLATKPAAADVGAVAKWAGTLKDLLSELRALDRDRAAADERSGRMVDVAEAGAMLEDLARTFVYGLDAVIESAPPVIIGALRDAGVKIESERFDACLRVVAETMRRESARVRSELVERIGAEHKPEAAAAGGGA